MQLTRAKNSEIARLGMDRDTGALDLLEKKSFDVANARVFRWGGFPQPQLKVTASARYLKIDVRNQLLDQTLDLGSIRLLLQPVMVGQEEGFLRPKHAKCTDETRPPVQALDIGAAGPELL
jgi:hypothetical protein